MGKRNQILVLLLLPVILASFVSAEHFYIVPNDSISQCQNYSAGTCFTLAEFASNSSYLEQDNLTLSFLPRQHLLTRRLTITGPQNIAVTGQNSSNSLSTIKCQGTSGIEFEDIQSFNIVYLEFTGCGNVESGGVIFISRAENVLIRGCHFTNNHVLGDGSRGGVLYVGDTTAVNIEESFFDNNYAVDGGAIHVSDGDITSTNVYYINNSGGYGGAIHVTDGDISSTNDHFINNSAVNCHINSEGNNGGAIYVMSGNIISTNNHYTNNNAAGNSGAIYVSHQGNINSTNDHWSSNSASIGGAIYASESDITTCSTNDYYIHNSAGGVFDGGAICIDSGDITSTNDYCINNSGGYGGAISIYVGNMTSTNDHYTWQ